MGKKAQIRIELLKHKYSVAIPDKNALKILSILARGQGVVQVKTSNHCKGYWAHLLSKNAIQCKVFNAYKDPNNTKPHKKLIKKKHKNKKLTKSKSTLAEEAKQWATILNADYSAPINEFLAEYSQFVLLFVHPDFMS